MEIALKIKYGSEDVTINKGEQHIVLTKKDLVSIVESAIQNQEVGVELKIWEIQP